MIKNEKIETEMVFDKIVLIASVIYPLTALPQIAKVYTDHSAHDLSLVSWLLYALLESVFLIYAVKKRLLPIIVQDTLWLIVYAVLIVAIVLYGN
jgi:MtN3 and saliva related transmembrane protein